MQNQSSSQIVDLYSASNFSEQKVEPKSFRNQLISAFVWITLIPFLLLAASQQERLSTAMEKSSVRQLEVTQLLAKNIDDYLNTNIQKAEMISDQLVNQESQNFDYQTMLEHLGKRNNEVVASWVLNKKGDILVDWFSPAKNNELIGLPKEIQNQTQKLLFLKKGDENFLSFKVSNQDPREGYLGSTIMVLSLKALNEIIHGSLNGTSLHAALLHTKTNQVIFAREGEDKKNKIEPNEYELTAPILQQLVKTPKGVLFEENGALDSNLIKTFASVSDSEFTVSVLQSVAWRNKALREALSDSGLLFLLAIGLTFFVGVALARPFTKSMEILYDAVESFDKTKEFQSITEKLKATGSSELVSLGERFEKMALAVKRNQEALSLLNENLEKVVEQRTEKLNRRNEELKILMALLSPENRHNPDLIEGALSEIAKLLCLDTLALRETIVDGQVPVIYKEKELGSLSFSPTEINEDNMQSLSRFAKSIAIVLNHRDLEDSLAKEHATLIAVLSSMVEGVVLIGKSGRIIFANHCAERLIGQNKSDLLQKDALEMIKETFNVKGSASLDLLKIPGETVELCDKNTGMQTLEVQTFTVSDLPGFSGDRVGFLLRDVTEKTEIATLKERLVSVVAHELKTPVTTMRLQAETLTKNMTLSNENRAEILDSLLEESERLSNLVNDWLDVSRMQTGGIQLNLKVVHIASVIDRAIRILQKRFDFECKRVISPEAECFPLDADRMTQVFINLLINANLYKKTHEKASVEIHVFRDDKKVKIVVKDHGIGINESELEKIFNHFYQVNMSSSRKNGGSGLGLFIVNGIMKAHSGNICVRSSLNEFTEFTLTMPY